MSSLGHSHLQGEYRNSLGVWKARVWQLCAHTTHVYGKSHGPTHWINHTTLNRTHNVPTAQAIAKHSAPPRRALQFGLHVTIHILKVSHNCVVFFSLTLPILSCSEQPCTWLAFSVGCAVIWDVLRPCLLSQVSPPNDWGWYKRWCPIASMRCPFLHI